MSKVVRDHPLPNQDQSHEWLRVQANKRIGNFAKERREEFDLELVHTNGYKVPPRGKLH
jgi:hypothetical protein